MSGLVAATVLLAMILVAGERRLGSVLAVAVLVGGATGAVLSAWRAGWRWVTAREALVGAVVLAALAYAVGWLVGR